MVNKNLVILVLLFMLIISVSTCSFRGQKINLKHEEVLYLTDTIKSYSDKLKRSSVERKTLLTTVHNLKELNTNLYTELKAERGNVKFITTTKMEYSTDTLYRDGTKVDFTIVNDSVITDFKLKLDTLVLGLRDDKVFVKSLDSNINITEVDATEIYKKPRRVSLGFFVGPSVSYGTKGLDVGVSTGFGVLVKTGKK